MSDTTSTAAHAVRGRGVRPSAGDGAEAPSGVVGAGERGRALAEALALPLVAWHDVVPSTMDEAHRLAEQGAPAGTLVLADAQSRGRGRGGKRWVSEPGAGLWLTLVERPVDASGLDVLSLRVGLHSARALDDVAGRDVRLKWPNDLLLGDGKVGGILVEVRWREQRPEWVAIGVGINLVAGAVVRGTGAVRAAALSPVGAALDRVAVLHALVPALRAAAAQCGPLRSEELEQFAARDWARGRTVLAPQRGTVAGISASGALLIETPTGTVACSSGSLVLDGDLA